MDKDRIRGAVEQAKGAVKEAAGKVMGDAKLQATHATEDVSFPDVADAVSDKTCNSSVSQDC